MSRLEPTLDEARESAMRAYTHTMVVYRFLASAGWDDEAAKVHLAGSRWLAVSRVLAAEADVRRGRQGD